MRVTTSCITLLALALTACGTNTTQRAATGGLTGAGVGALIGGPIGLVIGAAAGAAGGGLMHEGVDQMAMNYFNPSQQASAAPTTESGTSAPPPPPPSSGSGRGLAAGTSGGPGATTASVPIAPDLARQIQTVLKDEDLYDGPIDGIVGPGTRRGLANYGSAHGEAGSSAIDLKSMRMLTGQTGAPETSTESKAPGDNP